MPLPSLDHLRVGLLCSAAVLLAGVAKSDAALHITEFLASNNSTLNDEDGDSSDWIELFNSGPGSASLDGYYLTDDPGALTKWQLPAVSLAENGFLVVFASDKDRRVAGSQLHTNFKLSSAGEYLALVAPDGSTIVAEFGIAGELFPQQYEDISYGLSHVGSTLGGPGYLETPSPGSINGDTFIPSSPVADTTFSVDRGFFEAAFDLEITSATAGAEIRYTLDGTTPSPTYGNVYSAPITINSTTVVRAMAHLSGSGLPPTNVDTQTYLFLVDVVAQSRMDPGVTLDPTYAPQMIDSLKAVPTISLVTHDPTAWLDENTALVDPYVAASIEMIFPDGTQGFQENAGMKHFGDSSVNYYHKKSLRVAFRSAFGATKLRYPIFDGTVEGDYPPTDAFDAIDLRAGNQDMPVDSGNYMSNRFTDDTMLEMGHLAPHGRFVHVYLNGNYWGNYHLRERWNADMASSYLGGPKEDYDAVNLNNNFQEQEQVYDGDGVFWAATKAHVAGPDPWNGIDTYIDVPNLIDFMLLWHTGWCENEVRLFGSAAQGQPFRLFEKDADGWFRGLRVVHSTKQHSISEGSPIGKDAERDLMQRLKLASGQDDFPMLVADRIHKHFFNDGALTPAPNIARLQRRVDERKLAMLSEYARWRHREQPAIAYFVYDTWPKLPEGLYNPDFAKDTWVMEIFAGIHPATITHTQRMIDRFKSGSFSMYPSTDAPVFNINGGYQHGGEISAGDPLTMTNPNGSGTIYYTLDGTDVRAPGGGFSASKVEYTGPITLNEATLVTARVLNGSEWSAANVATYSTGAIGEDTLVITELMYHPADGGAEFVELKNIGANPIDLSGLTFSRGIGFTFPSDTVLQAGDFFILVRNDDVLAFTAMYSGVTIDGVYAAALDNGGETLEISSPSGVVAVVSCDNAPPWPPIANGYGMSLVPTESNPTGSQDDPAKWRASTNVNGSPGVDDPTPPATNPAILINEALTHTDDPQVDKIELYNPTGSPVDLEGWHLTDNNNILNKWTIPSGHVIPAGGYIVFQEGSGYSGGILQIGSDNFGSGFSLSALGEEVYIISPDYVYGHGFEFKAAYNAASNGTSFGRVTTTGGDDFARQTGLSFGSANLGPQVGPVVITEIMYHPANNDPDPANHDHEFVEIKNISAGSVNLYDAANPGNTWKINGVGFTFPTNTVMQSGDIIVVCKDTITPAAFRSKYSVPPAPGVRIFNYDGNLDNGSETVSLEAPDAPNGGEIPWVVIDKVKYDDAAPWPTGPGGPDGYGPSLERISESDYGNDASNWQKSESSGGTPGALTLIEAWRLANFGSAADSGDGADLSDPDFDGVLNLIEYGLGRSPILAAGSDGTAGLPEVTLAATHELLVGRLTFVCDLPDPAPVDVSYAVEASTTLEGTWTILASKTGAGAWVWQAGGPAARIVETSDAGRTVVQVGDVELVSAQSRRFMRLRVSR